MRCFLIFLILPTLAKAQSLILIGGNLKDDNAPIWNTMVEMAVRIDYSFHIHSPYSY